MAGLGQACPPQVFAIRLLLVLKQRDPMDRHRLTLLGLRSLRIVSISSPCRASSRLSLASNLFPIAADLLLKRGDARLNVRKFRRPDVTGDNAGQALAPAGRYLPLSYGRGDRREGSRGVRRGIEGRQGEAEGGAPCAEAISAHGIIASLLYRPPE